GEAISLPPAPMAGPSGSVTIRSRVTPPAGLPTPIRRVAPQPGPTSPRPTMLAGSPVQEEPTTPHDRAPQPTVVYITGRSASSKPDEVVGAVAVPAIDSS